MAVGDSATTGVEQRVLNGMMFIAFAIGVLTTIQDLVLHASIRTTLPSVIAMLAGLLGYLSARTFRKWRPLVTPVYVVLLGVLGTCWVTQGGSLGTVGYYFFLLVSYAVILLKDKGRVAALAALAGVVICLLLVEGFAPAWIMPYPTARERFSDVAFAMLLCLSMSAAITFIVYREYRRERLAKDALLCQVTAEKESALRSMQHKQRLLTVVSHDIANAVTVIAGEMALIRIANRGMPDALRLERAEYACNNIHDIIKSVRMIEAVEQGLVKLEMQPVDLRAVFDNAEMLFADRLSQASICLVLPDLPPDRRYVFAEPRLLANQVFNNLISNAIKFSRAGSAIDVTVAKEGESTTIAVEDHGVGIPPALLEKLFDVDAKTARPGLHGEPGTGFGMRTVKSFVAMFGGTIEVESRTEADSPNDHGTKVRIRLRSAAILS